VIASQLQTFTPLLIAWRCYVITVEAAGWGSQTFKLSSTRREAIALQVYSHYCLTVTADLSSSNIHTINKIPPRNALY